MNIQAENDTEKYIEKLHYIAFDIQTNDRKNV